MFVISRFVTHFLINKWVRKINYIMIKRSKRKTEAPCSLLFIGDFLLVYITLLNSCDKLHIELFLCSPRWQDRHFRHGESLSYIYPVINRLCYLVAWKWASSGPWGHDWHPCIIQFVLEANVKGQPQSLGSWLGTRYPYFDFFSTIHVSLSSAISLKRARPLYSSPSHRH